MLFGYGEKQVRNYNIFVILAFVIVIFLSFENYALGKIKVVDGDSLEIGDDRIRIVNIDAPEYRQYCYGGDGDKYLCGQEALDYLRSIINDKVYCKKMEKDRYERFLAECYLEDGTNIGAQMVLNGWALSYGDAYKEEERIAKQKKKGIWQGRFMRPELFRALQREQKSHGNKKM